jgi:hypothetical protein
MMSDIESACQIISEVGAHASCDLAGEEYDRADREARVRQAAYVLIDWVGETLAGITDDGKLPCDAVHVHRIAAMIADAMVHQHEHDQEMNGEIIAEMTNEGRRVHRVEPPRLSITPAAAEMLKAWLDHLAKEGGEA